MKCPNCQHEWSTAKPKPVRATDPRLSPAAVAAMPQDARFAYYKTVSHLGDVDHFAMVLRHRLEWLRFKQLSSIIDVRGDRTSFEYQDVRAIEYGVWDLQQQYVTLSKVEVLRQLGALQAEWRTLALRHQPSNQSRTPDAKPVPLMRATLRHQWHRVIAAGMRGTAVDRPSLYAPLP